MQYLHRFTGHYRIPLSNTKPKEEEGFLKTLWDSSVCWVQAFFFFISSACLDSFWLSTASLCFYFQRQEGFSVDEAILRRSTFLPLNCSSGPQWSLKFAATSLSKLTRCVFPVCSSSRVKELRVNERINTSDTSSSL